MIETPKEIINLIDKKELKEYLATNIELKSSWEQSDGKKISAFSNRISNSPHWMCIGINDDGSPSGHNEEWAKKTEEIISQHINKYLDPQIACEGIIDSCILNVLYSNPEGNDETIRKC